MIDYAFTYQDSRSKSVVVKHYSLANDVEACEMARLTYEFFGVQVTRGSVVIATNPSVFVQKPALFSPKRLG